MIDLRSDTVTKPTGPMREAMASAEVGDDVYGDDPTVNLLEDKVAQLFGKEAGLFTPTGSLANQLGIRTLVQPGEELLLDITAHIARAELGAAAAFSGITTRTWESVNGRLSAADPLKYAHPNAGPYLVSTKAIAVENTHNFGGGSVQSIDEIAKLRSGADEMGLTLHLDGARIWNAHVASGIPFAQYGKYFDTISVCLSKGLGAPVGSVLVSTKERISSARIWRKRYGAGMRQVGILAAAGIYALDHHIPDLALDHQRAKNIANAIAKVNSNLIDPKNVETNIVALDLTTTGKTASNLVEELKKDGLLAGSMGKYFLRLVTHRDLTDADIAEAIEILLKKL